MQRFRFKKSAKFMWKMSWVFTVDEIRELGKSCNFGFFESFYYNKRMKKCWEAIL